MQMDKLIAEVRSFGGNPWTNYLPADGGCWEAIMFKSVISDREFIALTECFPDAPPPPPAVLDELKVRGMIEEPERVVEPQPDPAQPVPPQPTGQLSEAERRRNRLHAHVDRTVERGERRRRR